MSTSAKICLEHLKNSNGGMGSLKKNAFKLCACTHRLLNVYQETKRNRNDNGADRNNRHIANRNDYVKERSHILSEVSGSSDAFTPEDCRMRYAALDAQDIDTTNDDRASKCGWRHTEGAGSQEDTKREGNLEESSSLQQHRTSSLQSRSRSPGEQRE